MAQATMIPHFRWVLGLDIDRNMSLYSGVYKNEFLWPGPIFCRKCNKYCPFPKKFSAFPAGKSCDITTCSDSEKYQYGPGQFS